MTKNKIILRGRLNGRQKTRLQSLLDMMYRPSELAEEIGFNVRQVYRVYIPLGLPHERIEHNHILINGHVSRDWVTDTYKKAEVAENETFCLTCKYPVEIIDPERECKNGLVYLLSDCPNCGRKCSKIAGKVKA